MGSFLDHLGNALLRTGDTFGDTSPNYPIENCTQVHSNDTSVWSIGDFLARTALFSPTSVTWWNTSAGVRYPRA